MQTKHLFLLPALAFLACAGLQAQVTIGGLTAPASGAILDLISGGTKGGLLLSNVTLPDLTTIPYNGTNAFPCVTSGNQETVKAQFKGAMVYHIGGNDIAAGVYVWAGKRWIPAGGAPTVKDAEGHEYSIAKFGDAGWWMTQNLRSTQYDDGTSLDEGFSTIAADKRYDYPGPDNLATDRPGRKAALEANDNQLLKTYGLLYSWAAASGRTDTDEDNVGLVAGYGSQKPAASDYLQGICPKDWHLPSDYEWSELEQEIATNPEKYSNWDTPYLDLDPTTFFNSTFTFRPGVGNSDDTYWGHQMKSMTPVPVGGTDDPDGTSEPREEGGFDALLVGYVGNSGAAYNYGLRASFWSSSSHGSSVGVCRYLTNGATGVSRYSYYKQYLFSVRCKKD
jgi:uncharacterized protein (TIGR02145 family)